MQALEQKVNCGTPEAVFVFEVIPNESMIHSRCTGDISNPSAREPTFSEYV
jgi:hypothetical protein